MEYEFKTADIAVLPFHTTTPHTILDAMSYELPVVSRNCWGNADYVFDGVTGLLVQPSKTVPYYHKDTPHPNFSSKAFWDAIKVPDASVVDELTQKLSSLVENPELRRRLGKSARWEVEEGRFSVKARMKSLKRIFDEAIDGAPTAGGESIRDRRLQ